MKTKIRELGDWELHQESQDKFYVKNQIGTKSVFNTKESAEKYLLLNFYKELDNEQKLEKK